MRRRSCLTSIAVLLTGLLAGCSTPTAPQREARFEITLDTSVQSQSTAQREAWRAYAAARIQAYQDLAPVRRNPAAEDYLIELRARSALARFWRDQQGKPDVPKDAYLDRLLEIEGAGLLEEHVLTALYQPGWTVPAAELAQLDFGALHQTPSRPETPTLATARPQSGKLASEIPGYALPDPVTLHPSRIPCTDSLPTLRRAVASWEQEEKQLDGAPASANSDAEFRALIAADRGRSPFRERGATWVSPHAYFLLFVAGFCANEIEDYPRAERWLESAMAMAPRAPQVPMELAHALVSQRKFDRADAVIDHVLATMLDRCELARAWRRRGYIRFEQRRLDDSRIAYQRSLEYDPDSPIARSELDLLRRAVAENGGHPDWYVPPPSKTHVTVCAN